MKESEETRCMKIDNEEQRNEMKNKLMSEMKNEESKICTQEIGSFEFLWDLVFGSGFKCIFFVYFGIFFRFDFGFRFLFGFFLDFHFRLIFLFDS